MQKTAYEMRISDWSSDVCSSDLAAEVVAVGKHFILLRQVGAARVHQVHARQAVLRGDLLRPQVFLDGHGVVGAALDRGVVADDDAFGDRKGVVEGKSVSERVDLGGRRTMTKKIK